MPKGGHNTLELLLTECRDCWGLGFRDCCSRGRCRWMASAATLTPGFVLADCAAVCPEASCVHKLGDVL